MKFNVSITMRNTTTGKEVDFDVAGCPMECANLASLMVRLANNLPGIGDVIPVGICITPAKEAADHA